MTTREIIREIEQGSWQSVVSAETKLIRAEFGNFPTPWRETFEQVLADVRKIKKKQEPSGK